MTKKALLLGAGMVARPLARYLLDRGVQLTVADVVPERAAALTAGHPHGIACALSVEDTTSLDALVADHQLTVSLLPAPLHPLVAEACLRHRRHLVTTSYVSPAMRALDQQARSSGVVLLNELGVDPGLDHMSAMRIIHRVQRGGGHISTFRSYCGGIPSPESNDNPWGYKFSWSPLGVLRAATSSAVYLKNGRQEEIPARLLFCDTHLLPVAGVGALEAYPNRDSLSYAALYGLDGVSSLFRGTLRYPGWSETMRRVAELGLLEATPRRESAAHTWPELLAGLIGARSTEHLRERVASCLWLPPDAPTLQKLAWLGLFNDEELPFENAAPMEQLAGAMQHKLIYREGERDMLVMQHELVADFGHRLERITSSLVDLGQPGGDSSMARTVGLPAAIAARLVLDGSFAEPGVHIPVRPDLYQPILDELVALGIALQEETIPL